jgi:hypothetical protein
MADQLRIVMENGWYRVMNRGIDARRLFPDNKANEHFRELLAKMPTRIRAVLQDSFNSSSELGSAVRASLFLSREYYFSMLEKRGFFSRIDL